MLKYTGEYGGRVLRAFKGDKPYTRDAHLEAEEVMEWPIKNRLALHTAGKVEWYGPPVDEVEIPQKPAPSRKPAAKPAEKKAGSRKKPAAKGGAK